MITNKKRNRNYDRKMRTLPTGDLTGLVFDALTVIRRVESPLTKTGKLGKVSWECNCSCGKVVVTSSRNLKRGQKSCGCLSRSNRFSRNLSTISGILSKRYYHYRRGAIERNLEFNITREFVYATMYKPCYYCGSSGSPVPNYLNKWIKDELKDTRLCGIDRVDNTIGYIESNCVPCCSECNVAKHQRTEQDFLGWVSRIYNFRRLHEDCGNK